ncbi:M50 family metallopeptidase [Pseudactinotalea sp. Z1748]|uniref:M50 family metallopeptidase n=1 Tax=Pseudactinotalea sp. Z1748 TaxID=3413027 RepID=UPI003C7D927F
MNVPSWSQISERIVPVPASQAGQVEPEHLLISAGIALALVAVGPLWRIVRLAVTLVHELGHALVGLATGRTFTGFVLRADMSGHAVTRGKPRGAALVATTWAGYPAPAILGAVLVWTATRGLGPPVLTAVLVILLISWVRVRSVLTALVMLAVSAGALWLWWAGSVVLQMQVLVATGLLLLIGAWRHLGSVWRGRDRGSDPAVLARLTPLPRVVWLLTFALVLAAATALVVTEAQRLLL